MQKECASQAEKAFKQKEGESTDGSTANFGSHYNLGMNKCFMVVRILTVSAAMGTKSWASTYLVDAYENRMYAELDITDLPWVGDHIGHRHMANCTLWPPHGSQRTCHSEAEFSSFVAGYMETTVQTQDTLVNPDQ